MNSLTHGSFKAETTSHDSHAADQWPSNRSFGEGEEFTAGTAKDTDKGGVGLRLAVLARAIEHEIIPRLMLAHRSDNECLAPPVGEDKQICAADVEAFAKLVLSPQEDVAHACVESLRLRGIPVETIYLDLLAPVARYLGELWDQDLCDFAEVTVGLGRLQQVLRELSPAFGEPNGSAATGRRILLLPGPCEQHTFGLVMVAEFFRRAGWDVAGGSWEAGADPVVMVRQEWFDVVGFSLGAQGHMDALRDCISSVRKAALNPHVGIMVGGPAFVEHPEFGAWVEADAVASDGRQATELAEQLVSSKPRPQARGARASQSTP